MKNKPTINDDDDEDSDIHEDATESAHNEDDNKDDNEEEEELENLELYQLDYETQPIAGGGEILQPGDHIYLWCTLYQHHGIVLETYACRQNRDEDGSCSGVQEIDIQAHLNNKSTILIAEFTNAALLDANNRTFFRSSSTASNAISKGVEGGFRIVVEPEPRKWHKVKYQANPLECMTWRPGTCSPAVPSPVSTILKRVQFLHDCRHLIPDYNVLCSNCETVAVWCVTGKWETLQGAGALAVTKMGAAALTASNMVLPGVGMAATGLLTLWSAQIVKQRQNTTTLLEREFLWYAMGKLPAEFCLQELA
ncbi:hypothetical protein ACA910_007287 [Epithemia clementina (nom. ined.)]